MAEQESQLDFEELDTVEVPEAEQTVIEDKADGGEQKEKGVQNGEETPEQRKARKRSDYQKRIGELTREKHEEREARAAAEARAELAEQRLREVEKAAHETTSSTLKQREQELIEKRRKAEEDADMAAYSAASDELFAVRSQMRTSAPKAEAAPVRRQQEAPQIVPEAAEWLENNPWFHSEENGHLADEVIRIQADLQRRGYNLNNPVQAKKVYAEIDRIIRERPEFDAVLGEEQEHHEESEKKPVPRSHIAPPSRGGEAPPRQKAGELNQHDITAIKRAGLDPNDAKVRATYIKYNRKQA